MNLKPLMRSAWDVGQLSLSVLLLLFFASLAAAAAAGAAPTGAADAAAVLSNAFVATEQLLVAKYPNAFANPSSLPIFQMDRTALTRRVVRISQPEPGNYVLLDFTSGRQVRYSSGAGRGFSCLLHDLLRAAGEAFCNGDNMALPALPDTGGEAVLIEASPYPYEIEPIAARKIPITTDDARYYLALPSNFALLGLPRNGQLPTVAINPSMGNVFSATAAQNIVIANFNIQMSRSSSYIFHYLFSRNILTYNVAITISGNGMPRPAGATGFGERGCTNCWYVQCAVTALEPEGTAHGFAIGGSLAPDEQSEGRPFASSEESGTTLIDSSATGFADPRGGQGILLRPIFRSKSANTGIKILGGRFSGNTVGIWLTGTTDALISGVDVSDSRRGNGPASGTGLLAMDGGQCGGGKQSSPPSQCWDVNPGNWRQNVTITVDNSRLANNDRAAIELQAVNARIANSRFAGNGMDIIFNQSEGLHTNYTVSGNQFGDTKEQQPFAFGGPSYPRPLAPDSMTISLTGNQFVSAVDPTSIGWFRYLRAGDLSARQTIESSNNQYCGGGSSGAPASCTGVRVGLAP